MSVFRYKFLFVRDCMNNHGQVMIPRGTSGILTLDECKAHLQCFRIIPNQGTHILTIKFDHIKPCIVMKPLNHVENTSEPDETHRNLVADETQRRVVAGSILHRDLGDHFPDSDARQVTRRMRQETVS